MESQLEAIIALQQQEGLKTLLRVFSFLGNEEFFLLLIPLIYLCVDARAGLRLGLLVLFGDLLNGILKLALHLPRPYWVSTRVQPLAADPTFGMPSSHAQNAVSVWFFLAGLTRRAWVWVIAACLIVLISVARVYLGVHFFSDIIGGWLIGAIFLWLFLTWEPKLRARFERSELKTQIIACAVIVGMLLLLGCIAYSAARAALVWRPEAAQEGLKAVFSRGGALFGLGVGWALMLRRAQFSAAGPLGQRAARFIIALVVLLLLWQGLAKIFPSEPQPVALGFRFIRYGLMTFWVTYLAPLLFLKMKLAAPVGEGGEVTADAKPIVGATT